MQIISKSDRETKNLGKNISQRFINKGGMIALSGDLGSGKTTFAQGLAKGLGIKDKVISPTFILIRQYKIPKSSMFLYHIDLYRISEKQNLQNLGLQEIIDSKNIILIEWADKIRDLLPKNTLYISFEKISEFGRKIDIR